MSNYNPLGIDPFKSSNVNNMNSNINAQFQNSVMASLQASGSSAFPSAKDDSWMYRLPASRPPGQPPSQPPKKKVGFYDDSDEPSSMFFNNQSSIFQLNRTGLNMEKNDFGLSSQSQMNHFSSFNPLNTSSAEFLNTSNSSSAFGSIGGMNSNLSFAPHRSLPPQSNNQTSSQQSFMRSNSNQMSSFSTGGGSSNYPGNITPTSNVLNNFGLQMTSGPSQSPGQLSPSRQLGTTRSSASQQQPISIIVNKVAGNSGTSGDFTGFGVGQARPYSGTTGSVYQTSSVFGGPGSDIPLLSLDLSEFPALNNRNRRDSGGSNGSHSTLLSGRTPYVGIMNKVSEPSNEFQIQQEDFPALPGSAAAKQDDEKGRLPGEKHLISVIQPPVLPTQSQPQPTGPISPQQQAGDQKSGIKTYPDGRVTNIPPGMVTDQFGIVGLLTFIRAADSDVSLVSLALGSDLTALGLNLNSPENLFSTFQSPFAETPCRPQDIDFHVPSEYLTNVHIRDKLANIKLNRYGEDLLFYLFYTNGGDVLQLAAAVELYTRDWRYHKDEKVWITRPPNMDPQVKTTTYERGTYYFFDWQSWRKVAKEFHLEYDKLEERPTLPSSLASYHPAHAQVMAQVH